MEDNMTAFVVTQIVTVTIAVAASSGFWAWLQRRDTKKSATTELLRGLAHDRIVFLGLSYIERGWITKDEYEGMMHYLYEPYALVGGNGLAEKVVIEIGKLPIRNGASLKKVREEGQEWNLPTPRARALPPQS